MLQRYLNSVREKIHMESTNLNQKYNFEKFILNNENKFAHYVALSIAKEPSLFNPVFFSGVSGSGKLTF